MPGRVWVRGINSAGILGAWSKSVDFKITTATPGVSTLTPIGTATTLRPTLTWTAASNAARYDLYVNNLTTGQTQVIRVTNLKTTQFTPTSNLTAGSYRVWVRGLNSAGVAGAWSKSIDVTIG